MTRNHVRSRFEPQPPDAAGIVTWVHVGDLHMDLARGQNHVDLLAIVQKINALFASSIAFVFLPGDNADHGSAPEYELVRSAMDGLQAPWCAIVGDHDVHEKSFDHFRQYMSPMTRYAFSTGNLVFFALNAFEVPNPGSFALLSDQLVWLEDQLESLQPSDRAVLLLHCYPTDLKVGSEHLRRLAASPKVLLMDMGHTHYNEVANDGKTLYTATRSTGQIEEGPVGFSVTNIDGGVVSWKFLPLTEDSVVMITFPADERMVTATSGALSSGEEVNIRVKAWGPAPMVSMTAKVSDHQIELSPLRDSGVWQGKLPASLPDGSYELEVTGRDAEQRTVKDSIRLRVGTPPKPVTRAERDQDNALGAWPERGLLGTQLGPNKNGKKW